MRQIAIYLVVGSLAAITHLSVVALIVEFLGLHPLAANVVGFLAGFIVSFNGHARFTFPLSPERYKTASRRFFAVSSAAFVLNQLAYAQTLQFVGARYYFPALAAVLLGVAVVSFLVSKLWAFAQPQG